MSSVCRICCVSGDTQTLFTLKNKKYIQAFEIMTNINFQTVGRPKELCDTCYESLLTFSYFLDMDRKSQIILNELAAKGQEATPEAIQAMMQQLSVDPGLQDGTSECIQITEEVSVIIERLDNMQAESAVWEKND